MREIILEHLGSGRIDLLIRLYQSTLRIALILLLAWLLLRLCSKGIRLLHSFLSARLAGDNEQLKRLDTLSRAFRYIASVAIILISAMVILSELGISIAPILATAGVLGIAVGFGAQSLIKDYFNGFFLLLENQVRRGDVVEAAGKAGLVEEVTLRYIRMRNYDGHVHFIPNGAVTTVTNLSRDYSYAVIDIGVAYRENLDTVMNLMRQVGRDLRADPDWQERILEDLDLAGVDQWADSAVVLRCRIKVKPLEQWNLRREYLRRLKQVFDEHGIEIPYPHLTLYPGQARDGSAPPLHIITRTATKP